MNAQKKTLNCYYRHIKRWLSSFIWLEPCAGGICMRHHRGTLEILCIAHKNGGYMLPKGRSKLRETLEETARREIAEETGIYECDIGDTLGVIRDRKRRKKITFFAILKPGKQSDIRDEHALWVESTKALQYMRHSQERDLLKRSIERSSHRATI